MDKIKKKIILYLIFSILVISVLGCEQSKEIVTPKKVEEKEQAKQVVTHINDKYSTTTTDDGMITFTLANEGKFSKDTVAQISEELNTGYKLITKELGIHLEEEKEIMVNLKEGVDESISGEAGNFSLDLYQINQGTYPLIHELTHILVKPKYHTPRILSEGIAEYTAEKYESWYKFYNFEVQKEMKFFKEHDIYIPLEDLFNKELEYEFLRPDWNDEYAFISYTEGHSLTKYLIDKYGMEKFMTVLNAEDAAAEIREQYHLTIPQLELEWLASLEKVSVSQDVEVQLSRFAEQLDFSYPKDE